MGLLRTSRVVVFLFVTIFFSSLSISCSKQTRLGIQNLPDRFIDREAITTAYYMPKSRLILDEDQVKGRETRLTHKYPHTEGANYVLHVEQAHHDKRPIIDPDYVYQMNLEIPPELFRPDQKILAHEMKGYVVWGGEHSIFDSIFCPLETRRDYVHPRYGMLHIKGIDSDGNLIADANLFFFDRRTGEHVRVFGKIVASPLTRSRLAEDEGRLKGDMRRRLHNIEDESWFQKSGYVPYGDKKGGTR